MNIEKGEWDSSKCLKSGVGLLERRDGVDKKVEFVVFIVTQ